MRPHARVLIPAIVAIFSIVACADAGGVDKPEADPDVATLSVGKADAVSNWWTTIAGSLELGGDLKDSIAYPDWFKGYTLELEAGQTVEFLVTATEEGWVRLYGPSHKTVDGQPRFKKALVKSYAVQGGHGELFASAFQVEVEEAGTYMLLYGPRYVWNATYKMKAECVGGCVPDDACFGDDECGAGEYCGHNGVMCITTPCDVSYDICKPAEAEGAWCDRDAMCAEGTVCSPETSTCTAPKVPGDGECETTADCAEGFCGCVDAECSSRICKPWQTEGQSCGGFTLPHYYTQCDPSLTCSSPYWIADLPGICSVQVTPEELYANPEAYDGRVVAVSGNILTGYAMCTKMACWEDNPCCNQCGAQQKLYASEKFPNDEDGIALVGEDGTTYGCGGNECNYQDSCSADEGEVLIIGTFNVGEYELRLDVQTKWSKPW